MYELRRHESRMLIQRSDSAKRKDIPSAAPQSLLTLFISEKPDYMRGGSGYYKALITRLRISNHLKTCEQLLNTTDLFDCRKERCIMVGSVLKIQQKSSVIGDF